MKKEECKKADVTGAPHAGSGKLTDYKKHGSWMMNQMEKGYDKCDRGIKVDYTDPEHKRFAAVAARIASESIKITKTYEYVSNSNGVEIYLKWMAQGDMKVVTLDEMNAIAEMLKIKSSDDMSLFVLWTEKSGVERTFQDYEAKLSFARPTGIYVAQSVYMPKGADGLDKFLEEAGFEKVEEK